MHTFTSGKRSSAHYLCPVLAFWGSESFTLGYIRLTIKGPEQRAKYRRRMEGMYIR